MNFFYKSLVLTLVISILICMCVCRPSMEARPRGNHGKGQTQQGMNNVKDLIVKYVLEEVEKEVQQEILPTTAATIRATTPAAVTPATSASGTRSSLSNASRFRRSGDTSPCVKSRKIDLELGITVVECYGSSPFGCTQNVYKNGSTLCKPVVKSFKLKKNVIIDCTCS
ncbi:uncharacterized protein LOC116286541 [Actinia tenebrosa]|uniref:Uncharacterized protein LOC116286541 n=1 Tax=Actinia tenebrosa TaxID=6105 RepID=A0A6P8H888_ACTTE|nr:uncharacterized protein LOC116286541 [Actinia tenebrosa]